jgi:hypothetical protein
MSANSAQEFKIVTENGFSLPMRHCPGEEFGGDFVELAVVTAGIRDEDSLTILEAAKVRHWLKRQRAAGSGRS